jgi:hypothetical protein
LARVIAGFALMAIFLGNGGMPVRIFSAGLLCAAWLWVEIRRNSREEALLIVYPDGRCRMDRYEVVLVPSCWFSRWYCVLVCDREGSRHRLLVSAGRHDAGEYRKLLTWLRLRNRADYSK